MVGVTVGGLSEWRLNRLNIVCVVCPVQGGLLDPAIISLWHFAASTTNNQSDIACPIFSAQVVRIFDILHDRSKSASGTITEQAFTLKLAVQSTVSTWKENGMNERRMAFGYQLFVRCQSVRNLQFDGIRGGDWRMHLRKHLIVED
jgi:hypothetical protein